jgi:hypothetical protein
VIDLPIVICGGKVPVLIDEALGPFSELKCSRLRPPIVQFTVAVEDSTLIVEGVCEFVAHHQSKSTKVQIVRHLVIEEWVSYDASRHNDLVFVSTVLYKRPTKSQKR